MKRSGGDDQESLEWVPPPVDECEEYVYDSPVGDDGDLMRFRQRWDANGRLADFAVMQMAMLDGKLACVAEADIRHGDLHVHILDREGRRIGRERVRPVATQQEVEQAYDAALDVIVEKWEYYKGRWRNG